MAKENIIAIHLGKENDNNGNTKAERELEAIKRAGEKKRRKVEIMQFFLPRVSRSPILNNEQLDNIANISKKSDLTGVEKTQVLLIFDHSRSHGTIYGTQYTVQNLADIFNGLAQRGLKPDINLTACAFGRRPWHDNRREATTPFGEFLDSIEHPRVGQKISGYRPSVFVDDNGRNTFDFSSAGDRYNKEDLASGERLNYKTMAIFDGNGEWVEPSHTEYSSKTGPEKNSIVKEDMIRSRNRIARNIVGSVNFEHGGRGFFEKPNVSGSLKGKMIGRDSDGKIGFLQLAPVTRNHVFQFIWVDPHAYGLESIKNGNYVNFDSRIIDNDGVKMRQVKAEKLDLSLEDGLTLELSNMLDKQIEQYKKVKDVVNPNMLQGTYGLLKKTDSAVYFHDGDGHIIKTSPEFAAKGR